jgi:hypothetical protein
MKHDPKEALKELLRALSRIRFCRTGCVDLSDATCHRHEAELDRAIEAAKASLVEGKDLP